MCKDSPFKSLRGWGLGNYEAFQGNHILVCLFHAWILRAKGICLLFKMTGPGKDYWSAWIKCLMACRASQTSSMQIRAANERFRALRWSPLFHRVKYSSANSLFPSVSQKDWDRCRVLKKNTGPVSWPYSLNLGPWTLKGQRTQWAGRQRASWEIRKERPNLPWLDPEKTRSAQGTCLNPFLFPGLGFCPGAVCCACQGSS